MAAGGGGSVWVDIPLDVFSLIFSKLSLPQLLRSAAVCVSWSAAVRCLSTRSRCFKFRGQSPWLVLDHHPRDDPSAVKFYAFDERRMYTIPVPDPPISDRLFLGSAHGWIITIDVRLRLHLLNPITGKQIDLPRVFSSEHTLPIRDSAGYLICFMMPKSVNEEEQLRRGISYIGGNWCLDQHHLKAMLSADPSLGDGYTVALIRYPYRRIFFTRCGDEQWFDLRNPISVENMAFHKGKLYISTLSEVYVCDLDDMPRFRVVDRALHRDDLHYLLETPRGDLLSIWRKRNASLMKTMSVEVHRVDDKENLSIRLEAKDLGDFAIFLDGRNSLCFSACDFPLLTPNSIYFTDDDIIRDPIHSGHNQRMFHIRHLQMFCTYVLPSTSVRLYWQPPSNSIN